MTAWARPACAPRAGRWCSAPGRRRRSATNTSSWPGGCSLGPETHLVASVPRSGHQGSRQRGGGGGVAGVRTPALLKTAGVDSAEIWILQYLFLETYIIFAFSNIFKIKWPKSEKKLNFGGMWDWVPMNPDVAQNRLLALKAKSVLNVLVVLFLLKIVLGIRWYHLFCTHVFRYIVKIFLKHDVRKTGMDTA